MTIDTAAIDAGWLPSKPALPLRVLALRYLRSRLELESRMDAGERVPVELGGESYEVVMVADSVTADGTVVRRGGLRVEAK